jgi:transketolase
MAGIAAGLASRKDLPVAATFAAFWTRAHDQIRMAQYSGTHQVFVGTHPGVSIGPDGASQMGLSDISQFRALEKSIVLYPADAYAAERLLEAALKARGLAYLRATRENLPLLYGQNTRFRIGGSATLRQTKKDRITVVGAGVTLHEALKAADRLKKRIPVRVIDLYSIKPIDAAALKKAARETGAILVVEDHRPEGGIAEAVRSALGAQAGCVHSLAVEGIPHSSTPEKLRAAHRIDARAIQAAVRKLLKSR